MLRDAYGNFLRVGAFYAGPDANELRAQIYYVRGPCVKKGVAHWIMENSRGEEIPIIPDTAKTLCRLNESALVEAINFGRVTIEDSNWFKRLTGKTVLKNKIKIHR